MIRNKPNMHHMIRGVKNTAKRITSSFISLGSPSTLGLRDRLRDLLEDEDDLPEDEDDLPPIRPPDAAKAT
nr:hypothetical protein [Tanacetum cinerariifolium]